MGGAAGRSAPSRQQLAPVRRPARVSPSPSRARARDLRLRALATRADYEGQLRHGMQRVEPSGRL
jgi:hypothetical protein